MDIVDQWISESLAAGDRDAVIMRMLYKIRRQREALHALNNRVVSQRFQLRTLNDLGRGLSAEEVRTAYDSLDEQGKARVKEDGLISA